MKRVVVSLYARCKEFASRERKKKGKTRIYGVEENSVGYHEADKSLYMTLDVYVCVCMHVWVCVRKEARCETSKV